ncbi:RNA methyltransferase [Actinoplanes sp. TBRC 11911]|uniref:TrmH family RNA methyltransferase n=1 Tax=Actinoplanes sp. TBRC 11911 TaxID=2729386 RepID=UPI00145C5A5B|nr:TrmH family RNA methyltransferase [Actinoplanes sp. TBRC 11911]NMO54243.1 RNA methyltransferase [Actinoplanes sp. TBRC 11911]
MSRALRVSTRNANFQQWQALLTNRTKRHRAGEFLVQGVRPISLAVEYGWEIRDLIYPDRRALSGWARDVLARTGARAVAMSPELVAELADKEDAELIAVVGMAPSAPIMADRHLLVVVFDRPGTPGNVGTLVRSADAFGASAVIITGHAADPYDPKAVRASTGSLFALPVLTADSVEGALSLLPRGVQIVATDEHGRVDVDEHDMTGPTAILVGNETVGLSAAWRDAAHVTVRIPITGAASSLNAAAAGTVVLYEAVRQRARPTR